MRQQNDSLIKKYVFSVFFAAFAFATSIDWAVASVRLISIDVASIQQTGSRVVVDLGAVWFGKVELNATPENLGKKISVILRESSEPKPLPSTGPEPIGVRFHEAKMILRNRWSAVPLHSKDNRLMPKAIGAVMPFRFIEIRGWKGDFPKSSIKIKAAIAEAYRDVGRLRFWGDERAGLLNEIWNLSSHTMAATSFSGLFVDGDRERLPYEADSYINQLGWLATAGELSVPRRTFEFLIDHPNWPTEWHAHMIFMAWADYMYSGDVSFLAKHYDRLKFLTLHDLISDNGLISTKEIPNRIKTKLRIGYPMNDIVDWPPNQRDNHDMRKANTVTNAFAYKAFEVMGEIASVLGNLEDRAFFALRAHEIRSALYRLALLDNGLFADGVGSQHTSAHSMFLPIAFGVVGDLELEKFLEALRERIKKYDGGFPGSVFTAQYLLEAMFAVGQDKLALALILNQSDRGWQNMLRKYGATITHESWDVKFKDNEDWTHAWGAAPANILPRYLLGIEPIAPGWTRWKIQPSVALDFSVEATIPTPQGAAYVRLDRDSNEAIIEVPEGTVCDFLGSEHPSVLQPGRHRVTWHSTQH